MTLREEMKMCEAWVADFHVIPTALVERAYRRDAEASPKERGLHLLAGGTRRSLCCDRRVTLVKTEGRARTYRCTECDVACAVKWRYMGPGWVASFGAMFRCPRENGWLFEHADEIAETCGLLVYDTDDAGILLGIDGADESTFLRAHWMHLFRFRALLPDSERPVAQPGGI